MTDYIRQLAKLKDIIPKIVTDHRYAFFVDNSGSTGDTMNGNSVLDHELSFIRTFGEYDSSKCVFWNTNAGTFGYPIYPDGGTDPCNIIKNKTTELIFDNCEIVFFMTDGQIGPDSVTKFSKLLENKLDKVLIVCLLFAKHSPNPNISVFAPFFIAKNVLIIQSDGISNKVLHTIGLSNNLYLKGSSLILSDLQKFTVFNNYPKIPEKFNVLSEDENTVKIFCLEKFLDINIDGDGGDTDQIMKLLSVCEWDTIVKMSKMSNTLETLRLKINSLRNKTLTIMMTELKKNIVMPYTDKKNKLIGEIMKATGETKKTKLVKQLQDLLPLTRIEEADAAKYINNTVSKVRSYWDEVRNLLSHYESSGYTLNDMTGLANRARRAKDISAEEEDESMVLQHENVPQTYCCLHLDIGPAVIWLDKPENMETTMGDHALTFPLDHFGDLAKCMKSNPVCGDCAPAYIYYSNGLSVYKESIVGYIPIDIKNNKRFVKKQLCKILCNSKLLSHVEMLMLSILDDAEHAWFDNDIRSYITNQFIENIMTNDTFSEEGNRVTMKAALLNLDTNKLLRQPIVAAFRLLGYLTRYDPAQKQHMLILLKERLAYKLIEIMLSIFLREGRESMIEKINNQLYNVICGIPCLDSNEIKLPSIREIVKNTPHEKYILKMLERIGNDIGLTIDELLPKQFIGQLLCSLKSITQHERPLAVYQKMVRNKLFSSSYTTSIKDATNAIINSLTEKYHKTNIFFIPPYVCYAGIHSSPTKLFFKDEPLLKDDEAQFTSEIMLASKLQIRLAEKLKEAYGNPFPNDRTGHIPLHKTVANVLEEEKFLGERVPTDEMYLACLNALKKTDGKRGNMYSRKSVSGVIYCVHDFIRVRNEFSKTAFVRKKVFDLNALNFSQKLKNELEYYGFIDNIPYSKITVPVCLSKTYASLNVEEILMRLNSGSFGSEIGSEIGSDTNKNQSSGSVIDLKYDEIFTINIPESAQKLEKWKMEQEEILKELNLTDTINESDIKLIGGMDISFDKNDDKRAVASIVVYSYPTLKMIARASIRCSTNIKYIPSFLAFREVPILIKLYQLAKESGVVPDLILMDGNGIWHPRFCGVASHFSVLTGIPCVGIAKNVLVVDDINEEKVFDLIKYSEEGSMTKIVTCTGKELGVAYNVTGAYKNSTFISAGNGLSLETAMRIVRNVTLHRVTEPIRQADLLSRQLLDNWKV